jgi:serine/threonine protein kinase
MNDAIPHEDEAVEALVCEATNDFMDRVHRGEGPDVDEYVRRYPPIAGILRQLLPAVRSMPQSGTDGIADDGPGPGVPEPLGCLGDFRLIREIGRGGMAIVYEGEQISLGRRVALKVMPFAGALDPKQLQRFKREVQAAAHLDHPNVVHVYSVGCERGVHYYAMQYIEGHSLAEMIHRLRQLSGRHAGPTSTADTQPAGPRFPPPVPPEAPLPAQTTQARAAASTVHSARDPAYFQTVAALAAQAAEALEHAHGLGVVHRDIKPGNLLADAGGKLWVTDFGLAQFQSEAGLTRTGTASALGLPAVE